MQKSSQELKNEIKVLNLLGNALENGHIFATKSKWLFIFVTQNI
jgi:hypothetical protein